MDRPNVVFRSNSNCYILVVSGGTYGKLERNQFGEFSGESEHVEHVEEGGKNECDHRDELDPAAAEWHELRPDRRTDERHQREHLHMQSATHHGQLPTADTSDRKCA